MMPRNAHYSRRSVRLYRTTDALHTSTCTLHYACTVSTCTIYIMYALYVCRRPTSSCLMSLSLCSTDDHVLLHEGQLLSLKHTAHGGGGGGGGTVELVSLF